MKKNELITTKHVLFLENEYWGRGVMVGDLYDHLVGLGIKCTIIDNAANRKDEIIPLLSSIDTVCFESTFLYGNEIKGIGNLLKKCPKPLLVFGCVIGGNTSLKTKIESLWSLTELIEMSHHRVFEMDPCFNVGLLDEGEWYKEIDMSQYKAEFDLLEAERINKNKSMPKTGNKVLIKTLQYFGTQLANIKPGDVVDELDCSSIDKKPNRGIWVMGVDEPVKLLNSDGYDEWEYFEPSYLALTKELYARTNQANCFDVEDNAVVLLMAEFIRGCGGLSETELWSWTDVMCDAIGVGRRGHRNQLYKRLTEYGKRFKYFKEPLIRL
jgi:hypothetical protein